MVTKKVVAWGLGFATLATLGANLVLADKMLPFSAFKKNYNIAEVLVDRNWISAMPIYLAQNFKSVNVRNIGSEDEKGFGFSDQIQYIWNGGTADHSADPIDLQTSEKLAELQSFEQYHTFAYCKINHMHCRLDAIYDPAAKPAEAVFVGVKLTETRFAIVEETLLNKILGEAK